MINRVYFGAALLFWSTACTATVSDSRRAYIRAHDHGWIEIRVEDADVTSVVTDDSDPAAAPPHCSLEVTLNREPYLYETLYSYGETAPYRVETGFRFEAPAGKFEMQLTYSGCAPETAESNETVVVEDIWIDAGMVSPVFFDGDGIVSNRGIEDEAVTLERVYEELLSLRGALNE